jgi:hypothetical protein
VKALLLLAPLLVAASPPPVTNWYRLVASDGEVIGTGKRVVTEHEGGRDILDWSRIRVNEQGNVPRDLIDETLRREDAKGQVLTITHSVRNGKQLTRTTARFIGQEVELTRVDHGHVSVTRVPLPVGTRVDQGTGLLSAWNPDRQPHLEFPHFSIAAETVERVTIDAEPKRDGEPGRTAIRRSWAGENLRAVTRLHFAEDGSLLSSSQPMFGTSIRQEPSDEAAATSAVAGVSLLRKVLVKSPYRISPAAMAGHIRYTFRYRDGLSFPIPESGEQRVRIDGERVTIDVCATCGVETPLSEGHLSATTWMQSDHPRIRKLAAPAARSKGSIAARMADLSTIGIAQLPTMDFSGHYSALAAIQRGRGDCTETASVLAALARAAGIPSRTVHGLVYSREKYHGVSHSFMPHSWTQVWVDGQWRSFDMALGSFDSTHIMLTTGEGEPRAISAANQLSGLLIWESMVGVKSGDAAQN